MRRYILIGVAVYAIFLLANFPAQVALHWFAPDSVKAWGVEGPIWSGRAQALSVGSQVIGETSWDLNALWLVIGNVSADVNASLGKSVVKTSVSKSLFSDTVKLNGLQGIVFLDDAPDNLLRQIATTGVQRIDGRLGLSLSQLHLTKGWPVEITGSMDLVNVDVSTQLGAAELGSFELLFDGVKDDAGSLTGKLADTDSTIALDGSVVLNADRSYRIEAVANARPGASADIVNALNLFGSAAPNGGARFDFGGMLALPEEAAPSDN